MTRMGNLIDLGDVELLAPNHRRLSTVLLADGPCAGTYAQIANVGMECWQRVGKPRGAGIDSRMWARYNANPMRPGEYVYSGFMLTSDEMQESLARHEAAGHTYGESYGA
jgi:hypothetical protein